MLQKPRLTDEQISTCLHDIYGVKPTTIEFLPIGYDAYAGVYRITASDSQDYFLKAKLATVPEVAIKIPRYLKSQGLEQVVAPLPTMTDALWGVIDDYKILLYPYIEGKAGMEVGLSESQWREFGSFMRQLHATQLPEALADMVAKEAFLPYPETNEVIKRLQAEIPQRYYDHPLQQALARFWLERQVEIARITARAAELGQQLQERAPEFVLCHADIHAWNIMVSRDGGLHIVDWDQPILAPRERDLMFILHNPIGAAMETAVEAFQTGYGNYAVDPLAMAYYRYDWVVQDVGAFAEQVFYDDNLNDPARQQAYDGFVGLFSPGSSVEFAYQSEINLKG